MNTSIGQNVGKIGRCVWQTKVDTQRDPAANPKMLESVSLMEFLFPLCGQAQFYVPPSVFDDFDNSGNGKHNCACKQNFNSLKPFGLHHAKSEKNRLKISQCVMHVCSCCDTTESLKIKNCLSLGNWGSGTRILSCFLLAPWNILGQRDALLSTLSWTYRLLPFITIVTEIAHTKTFHFPNLFSKKKVSAKIKFLVNHI